MRYLFVVFLFLILYSCTEKPPVPVIPPFEFQDVPLKDKIKTGISEAYLQKMGLPDSLHIYLNKYYSLRDFEPKWINDSTLTPLGQSIKKTLLNSCQIGIPRSRIINGNSDNFIQDEINLTIGLAQVIHDLKYGLIDYDQKKPTQKKLTDADSLDALINFSDDIDLPRQFIKFGPSDTLYHVLANGLLDFLEAFPLDSSTFEIRSIKYDSLHAFDKTSEALFSKGYLKEKSEDSIVISEALQKFQIFNGLKPDGIIGKYTARALNESTVHKVERIILSMDKTRTRAKRPEKYIAINIPEYKLRFFINDSLKSEHKIVTGTVENQTPELTSKMSKIVVYPYWNVPYSISSKEILPHLKQNPGYLKKHNYVLLKNGEEIDPYSVNWKRIRKNSFPYKIRQEPGPKNSLGIIKFDFYNPHSVYFHDTPTKSLFGVDIRAYSHGCMRTENPIDLAKAILSRDEYRDEFNVTIPDSLDSLIARKKNVEIKILDRFPIYVEYQTVCRIDQRMVVYTDIYGRDEEFIRILRE